MGFGDIFVDLSGKACRGIGPGFRGGEEEGDFIKPAE
jgi:hypothetical protein